MSKRALALGVVALAAMCGMASAQDAASGAAAAVQPSTDRPLALMVGDKAPELFIEKWVKGDSVTGFEKGKPYVVEFWATWCGPCKKSIPHLTEIQKEYGEKGLDILGVSIWEDRRSPDKAQQLKNVETFVTEKGDEMAYTVCFGDSEKMTKTWMKASGRQGIPSAFIVNREGQVAWIGNPLDTRFDKAVKAVVENTHDIKAEAAAFAKEYAGEKAATEFQTLLQGGDFDKAFALAKQHVDGGWRDNEMLLNMVAWTIVDPEGQVTKKDLDLALKAATRANELTKSEDPAILDTLAMVYYSRGELAKALEWQEKAAKYAKGTQFEAEINGRLEQFREAVKNKGG